MIRLSPPVSRVVAVGLLLLIPAMLYGFLIAPLWDHYLEGTERVARLRLVMERGLIAQRQRDELIAQVSELRSRPNAGGDFLRGDNEAIIGAALQDQIKQFVEAARGELSSTQVLPGRDEGQFRRISVRAQMGTDAAGLQRLIYDIEAHVPYLFVDNLRIRAPISRVNDRRPEGGSAEGPDGSEKLVIVFDVYGYIRSIK